MLLTDKTEVIVKGTLSFNENVKFTIFKCDEDDRYSFINIDDGNNHDENSFYDVELLNLLKAINNNDFEALKKINKDIEEAILFDYYLFEDDFSCCQQFNSSTEEMEELFKYAIGDNDDL